MTRQPSWRSGTAYSAATPCGRARKTTSACFARISVLGSVNRRVLAAGWFGEFREHHAEVLAGVLAGGDRHQFGLGMVEQEADEFLARVARGPDDSDFSMVHRTGAAVTE